MEKGKNKGFFSDLLGTGEAKLIPSIIEAILKSLPKEIYKKVFGDYQKVWSMLAPLIGFIIKRATNFNESVDGFITEFFQEFSQQIDLINAERDLDHPANKNKKEEAEKIKFNITNAARFLKLVMMADEFESCRSYILDFYNKIIVKMDNDDKSKFIDMISKMPPKKVTELSMLVEADLEVFLKNLFPSYNKEKEPEPVEKEDQFHKKIKEFFNKIKDEVNDLDDFLSNTTASAVNTDRATMLINAKKYFKDSKKKSEKKKKIKKQKRKKI